MFFESFSLKFSSLNLLDFYCFVFRNGAKSYYDVLGVGKTASFEEIKRAYFERSKLLHPDRNNGNTGDFMALKKAYDVLRRPADRRAYDMGLSGVPPPPSSYGRRRGKEAFYK